MRVCARVCWSVGSQWPRLLGHSSNQEMRWESFSKRGWFPELMFYEIGQIKRLSFCLAFAIVCSHLIFSLADDF